jgi:capsular exopolysaccharide synthesis family protein
MQTLSVDKDINPESVAILERASRAMEVRPNHARSLIIGAVLGLLAGVGLLMLVDRFDDRPISFTDLTETFDEPVLGQIPLEKSRIKNGNIPIIHESDTRHALLEAYRNLRSSLLYMATEGKRPKTLVVTSAIPSDGKSMTTANLAVTLALGGSRVLLVDADLRRGQLHAQFKLPSSTPGLTEVLSGFPWAQAVQPTDTPNLSLLPRGNLARNPGELFLNQRTRDLLNELAAQFDYVIIDTAPVMAADDVTSLSPHVEGVIFVIRAGYTSGRVARAALDLLYQREVDVLGLVFNGVETNASEYYYYKYKNYYAENTRA